MASPSGQKCQGVDFICFAIFEEKAEHKVAVLRSASLTDPLAS